MQGSHFLYISKDLKCFFLGLFIFYSVQLLSQKGFVTDIRLTPVNDSIIWIQSVLPDPYGGYLVSGLTGQKKHATAFQMHLDCSGEILWSLKSPDYRFSFDNLSPESNNRLGNIKLIDKEHYFSDITQSFNDYNGNIRYQIRLMDPDSNTISSELTPLKKNYDGGWIFFYSGIRNDTNNMPQRVYAVIRTDKDFNQMWSKSFIYHNLYPSAQDSKPTVLVDNHKLVLFMSFRSNWFITITLDQKDGELLSYYNYKYSLWYYPPQIFLEVLHDKNFYYVLCFYENYSSQFSTQNLAIHKIRISTGALVSARQIIDYSYVDTHGGAVGTFKNSNYDFNWCGSSLCIGVNNYNYLDIPNNSSYSYGYPTYMRLDTALNLLSVERIGVETDSIAVSPKFGAHNQMYIRDSFCSFACKYDIDDIHDLNSRRNDDIFIAHRSFSDINCLNRLDMSPYIKIKELDLNKFSKNSLHDFIYGPEIRLVKDRISPNLVPFEVTREVICTENPSLDADISQISNHYCLNDTVWLDGSQSINAHNYHWLINDSIYINKSTGYYIPDKSGNYTISLIVSDLCFSDTTEFSFTVYGYDTVYSELSACLGDTLSIDTVKIVSSGQYHFKYNNKWGCDSLVIMDISFYVADTTFKDTLICAGKSIQIDGKEIRNDTSLVLMKSSFLGCDSFVVFNIQFDQECQDCKLMVPLVFSPNGDNLNDSFRPINPCEMEIQNYSLSIYSRWGELVFRSNDPKQSWDGKFKNKDATQDVYIILLQAQLESGETIKIRKDLTLIR